MVATPKKDNVVINMVLQLPLVVRYPKCGIQGERTSQEQKLG